MKKRTKVILGSLGIVTVLGIGGCTLSLFAVGSAVNTTVTDMNNEDKAQEKALADMLKNAPKPVVKKDEFTYNVTYTFTNKSKFDFDYIELDLNVYDKDNVKLDTNMTNITDVKAGQTFKMTVDLYQDGADHFDVNALTNSPLK